MTIRINSYAAYRISYQYRIILRIPYTNMIRIFGDDPLVPPLCCITQFELRLSSLYPRKYGNFFHLPFRKEASLSTTLVINITSCIIICLLIVMFARNLYGICSNHPQPSNVDVSSCLLFTSLNHGTADSGLLKFISIHEIT